MDIATNLGLDSKIVDDERLLDLMMRGSSQSPKIYQPGSYWQRKSMAAISELKKYGLSDFRGPQSAAGTSYSDSAFVDTRGLINFGLAKYFSVIYRNVWPFHLLFDSQVSLTRSYYDEMVKYEGAYLRNNDRVRRLLGDFIIPDETTLGGCLRKSQFEGRVISHYYLTALDTLSHVLEALPEISEKRSYMEIGGGFGVNTHLMIENFPNMKKVIYIDIPPNLYVGTQYLKSFYGDSVIDFGKTKNMKSILFNDTDELEIYCLIPSQIEKIRSKIDYFYNAHSFVEMPSDVVRNYAKKTTEILSDDGMIALVSYDHFNLESTLDPDTLPNFFNKSFTKKTEETLTLDRKNFHYFSRNR